MNFNKGKIVLILSVLLIATGCRKMYDIEPKDLVDEKNAYLTVADADAAVIGIYGKLTILSKQYVILNELRADLMDVTVNADPYLQEINNHQVSAKNPYANPRPFYELIANCNDALRGFDKMLRENRMSVEEYQRRYSDIGSVRSWVYLQLGIQYGKVPYVTKPIDNVEDVKNLSKYPRLEFRDLLDSLINFTSNLKYNKNQIFTYPAGSTLNVQVDANNSTKFFITRSILLGDLYLWKGDFLNASTNYKLAMDAGSRSDALYINDALYAYRVPYDGGSVVNTVQINDGTNSNQDTRFLYTGAERGWRSLFAFSNTNRSWNAEWYWSLPYGFMFNTKNPLPNLFSQTYGDYLLKPSKAVIDNWNSQIQTSGTPGDPRGMMSYTLSGTDPVITKYTDDASTIVGGGQWNIWRAAGVHLRFAESANRDGKGIISWGLLNSGIANALIPVRSSPPTYDELQQMQTSWGEPYYFDARDAGATNNSVRQPWSKNYGIRRRGFVLPLSTALQTNVVGLEDALINEAALELAFEGQRWADLLRISMRRNDPSFLANKVYEKLAKAGNPNASTVKAKLESGDWYLPFDIFQ